MGVHAHFCVCVRARLCVGLCVGVCSLMVVYVSDHFLVCAYMDGLACVCVCVRACVLAGVFVFVSYLHLYGELGAYMFFQNRTWRS